MKKLVSLSIAISDTSISTSLVERSLPKKKDDKTFQKPIIKTYRFKSINPEHKDITQEYLEQRLEVLLRTILNDTRHQDVLTAGYNVGDIEHISISLSAPWFEGKAVTSHFNEAKEFKVTPAIIKQSFDTEIKSISGQDKLEIAILESNILSSTLNGYTITDPMGKTAKSLTLHGYVSYVKMSTKQMILGLCDSFFHEVKNIVIKSEPTILLKAAIKEAKLKNFENNYAIIRVNEILTHIQIIKDEHIRELGTIPIGLNHLLKEMSTTNNITSDVALNLLKLYVEKKLQPDFEENLGKVIKSSFEKWRNAIKEFSSIALVSGRFPSNVFLSSPSVISHVLKDYLLNDNYLDLTMSEEKLTIEVLDRASLNDFVDIGVEVKQEPGFLTKLSALE